MNRSRVGNTALPSSKKTHSERHKQILKQLLKEEANKTCVDCKTTAHPRWASWNLGCFICIRCSGIHRSMGTHISKVKSVDLDAWTDEQVESMVKWGNYKCNSYWEDKLPDGYIPDQSKIENFIRTKYDLKKWVGSPTVPDPMKLSTSGSSTTSSTSSSKANVPPPPTTSTTRSTSVPVSSNLLDDDFGTFTSVSTPSVNTTTTQNSSHGSNQSINSIQNNGNLHANGSASATPKSLPKLPIQTSNSLGSPQSTGGSMNGRPDLKKSILSLYSSPSSSNASFVQPVQRSSQPSQPSQPSRPSQPVHTPSNQSISRNDTDLLTDSLSGLNFTSNINSSVNNSSHSTINSTASNKNWNNEWSDISNNEWNNNSPANNMTTSNLDDDLFKNVWK